MNIRYDLQWVNYQITNVQIDLNENPLAKLIFFFNAFIYRKIRIARQENRQRNKDIG